MLESTAGVEDERLQRLLDGTFKDSPLAKRLRNRTKPVKKPPLKLDTDQKLLTHHLPNIGARQADYMIQAMQESFIGIKEVDERIRQFFLNDWKGDSIEEAIKQKQRMQKADVLSLRFFLKQNMIELLRLFLWLAAKLCAKNFSTKLTGDTVITYTYPED